MSVVLKPGDKAPNFKLRDQDGNLVELADFKGVKLLVYFYPRADTPGCTRQACAIRDSRPDLAGLDLAAVGISQDKPEKLIRFDQKYDLRFPLLSDPDRAVAGAFGAFGEKKSRGKITMGIIRSSFLIDGKGKIQGAWYKVKPEDTVPKRSPR
ncbi:MAG: thioredoxin-dependent thiol peroxidase, partial [Deltaproteobacteria bacterium]|nr:thioredoxin-dependent thiol peroxidase [Deltaproteobacteria bacterium]